MSARGNGALMSSLTKGVQACMRDEQIMQNARGIIPTPELHQMVKCGALDLIRLQLTAAYTIMRECWNYMASRRRQRRQVVHHEARAREASLGEISIAFGVMFTRGGGGGSFTEPLKFPSM